MKYIYWREHWVFLADPWEQRTGLVFSMNCWLHNSLSARRQGGDPQPIGLFLSSSRSLTLKNANRNKTKDLSNKLSDCNCCAMCVFVCVVCAAFAIFSQLNSCHWHWPKGCGSVEQRSGGLEDWRSTLPYPHPHPVCESSADGVAMAAYYFIAARINLANADKKNAL